MCELADLLFVDLRVRLAIVRSGGTAQAGNGLEQNADGIEVDADVAGGDESNVESRVSHPRRILRSIEGARG